MAVLVLGTHNLKKARELIKLLEPYDIEVKTLQDFENSIKVDETGSTFAENAALKASQQAKVLSEFVLGEDSGLSVDALNGAPGVYSARFAGTEGDDEANNEKLLAELGSIPRHKRTAKFTCHAALSDPNGNIVASHQADCRGIIGFERCGTNGFGYDPLFEIAEFHRTFAELGDEVKSVLSHRARALRMMIPKIVRCLKVAIVNES